MEALVLGGMRETRRLVTAIVAAATVAACSGGDGGTDPEPTPTIDIAVASATLAVAQGANQTVNLTLTRGGGFTGDVAITFEGVPAGVTASATPSTLGASVTSAVITFTAAGTAATGTNNVTVRATGTGVTAKTATIALTINAAPTYSLAATAATVVQGATGTSNITITRAGGFAGNVTLAADGLPTGVTAAFNPNNTATNASTLTLTASATATPGTSTITVRGTATGQTDKTATFQLTVTAAGGGGSFTLAVTETNVSVAQGATGTANITITRTGGFTGAVNLTAENLPTGVTASFNPQSIPANGTTSVLTLTVAANAPAASGSVLVRGASTGQQDKSATFLFTVTAAPVGGFSLGLTSNALTVQQGTSGNTTVNITRTNGFAGTVNLTATGLPNGVTAGFNPAGATGNTSTLTLTAAGTATVGQATVTVRGNSGTLAEQTTTLTLNVTAAAGGSGNTVYEFCTASQTPLWLAVQDGATATWTRVAPSASGTRFQFNITQAKAGVAFVVGTTDASISSAMTGFAGRVSAALEREMLLRNRPTPARVRALASRAIVDGFSLVIYYGTQAELSGVGTSQCLPGAGKTVNGTVAGVTGQATAEISLGPSSDGASAQDLNFQLRDVPDGALDLVAGRSNFNLQTFTSSLEKLIIRRAVNAANNSTLPVLDFGSAEAFDPATATLTIGNLGADLGFAGSFFFTASGSGALGASLFSGGLPSAGPFPYYGVPLNKQIAGDMHLGQAFAFPNSQTADQFRIAGLYFKDPTNRTVTLGPAPNAATVTAAATAPYVRFRATGNLQTEYRKTFAINYIQGTTTVARDVTIQASEGYLTGLNTFDFTIPDFTGVAGWDNNWGPKVGTLTTWTTVGAGFTGVGFGSATPVEGSTFAGAARTGTITP